MKLKVGSFYSQRDPQWGNILLGYNTDPKFSIYWYGCLITCLSMYLGKRPDEVNQLLKDNDGFVTGNGVFIWNKSSVLGLKQTYLSSHYDGPVTSQGIIKIKELFDQGYPLLAEIDFNPATDGEEMHYVLLSGYEGESIFACDPWTGQYINLDVYGGPKRAIIQFRAYDKQLPLDGGVDLQKDLDGCRIDRDTHWNDLQAIKNALVVVGEYSLTNVMARTDGLLGIESQQKGKDQQITDAQKRIAELEQKVKSLTDDHDALVAANGEDQTTMQKQGFQIKTLQDDLQNLKNSVTIPALSGWGLIVKGIATLFGK